MSSLYRITKCINDQIEHIGSQPMSKGSKKINADF